MKISRALHDQFTARLEALLDERDDVAEQRRRITKALRGDLNRLDEQIGHARRVLKGIDTPQLEIPGTEALGDRGRDSVLQRILEAAARLHAVDVAEGEKKVADATDHGEAGAAEPDPKARKVKQKPAGLSWVKADEGHEWAGVTDGAYHIERKLDGLWTACFAPKDADRSLVVGGQGLAEKAVKDACEAHFTQLSAPTGEAKPAEGEEPSATNGEAPAKATVPPLEWKWVRDDVQAAQGKGITYEVERSSGPGRGWSAYRIKPKAKKRTVLMVSALDEQKAKDACAAHHIEQWANAMLPRDMARSDLTGPAMKRKRGGGAHA